jgi:hypothetical protein
MPVKLVFRCQFCEAQPDAQTHASLVGQVRELQFGEYLDMLPGRWLVWTGHGQLGPKRFACAEHRGDLTAYVREHYGCLAKHPWKRPPYPTTLRSRGSDRAFRMYEQLRSMR